MLIPYKLRVPSERPPFLTLLLIAANVVVYIATSDGLQVKEWAVDAYALTGQNASLVRMLTCSFLHGDIFHILGNMWFLWLYGRPVEGRLGALRFLAVYFLGDLAGSCLHLLFTQAEPTVPSLGASGAVMSLMGSAAWLFPFSRVAVFYWLSYIWVGTWEVRVWIVAGAYFVLDVISGALGAVGVANFAHVGGALGGLVVSIVLRGKRDSAAAGEALSILDEGSGLDGLTRSDLLALNKNSPGDLGALLALVRHDVSTGRQLPPDVLGRFVAAFPAIERTVPSHEFTGMVEILGASGTLPAEVHMAAGRAAERDRDLLAAQRAYSRALATPGLTEADAEFGVFKLAQLLEGTPVGRQSALAHYRDHARRWPMSPFHGQVRARIASLERGN